MQEVARKASAKALLEAFGANEATGAEAFAAAEKGATVLTARAGSRDPSSIPIFRISATLRHNSGTEGTDSALASVLESLEFCLKPCSLFN